jgi:hypothetical protein
MKAGDHSDLMPISKEEESEEIREIAGRRLGRACRPRDAVSFRASRHLYKIAVMRHAEKEDRMKLKAPLAGAALVLASSAGIAQAPAPAPATVCLNMRNIERTEVQDDRTILFHMRDGKVWVNRLRRVCPMLKTSPWTQVLHSDQVCANQQFIHVTRTGDTCALGDFTPAGPER